MRIAPAVPRDVRRTRRGRLDLRKRRPDDAARPLAAQRLAEEKCQSYVPESKGVVA
ncbi:MAG: hypothetical protein ACYTKD_04940 [Planctomycetota bacterium]